MTRFHSIRICIAGNIAFRQMVLEAVDDYMRAGTRYQKSFFVLEVVDKVRNSGGRFLKREDEDGHWIELSDQSAKEKVGQSIRAAINRSKHGGGV